MKYNNESLIDFLIIVYDADLVLDDLYVSDIDMFNYLEYISGGFQINKLKLIVQEIREFSDKLGFFYDDIVFKPNKIPTSLLDEPSIEDEICGEGQSFHFTTPLSLEYEFGLNFSFHPDQTLKERAEIIKKKLIYMVYAYNFERLIKFSEMAENEYLKAQSKNIEFSPISIESIESQVVTYTVNQIRNSLHSFTYPNYNTNKEAINDLLKHLIKCNFVSKETDMVDFRKIFNNTPIENKIIWTGNISELSYFIKQLHNEKKKVEDLKQRQWEATINCFVLSDGSPLERSKLRSQKPPASTVELDKAVKMLL